MDGVRHQLSRAGPDLGLRDALLSVIRAARFWTGSTFAAAGGAALAMLRVVATESLLPLLAAGTLMVFAVCLAAMGIRKFFDRPVNWRGTWLITGLSFAGLTVLHFRLRQRADADFDLFDRPVGAAGAER